MVGKSQTQFDAVVVGGGIIGASCAYELAKKGMRTALLDFQPFGQGASGSSAAMLEFQLDAHRGEPFFSLAKASADLFPPLYREIKNLTQIDFQYERCGILQLALNDQEAKTLQNEALRQQELGLEVTWLTSDQLSERLPFLSLSSFGGVIYEGDGQVNGEKFLSAMIRAARTTGVQAQDDLKKISLLIESGRIVGVQTPKGDFRGKVVVVAAGAWTDQLLGPIHIRLGIEPIRGQLVVYDTPRHEFPFPVYTASGGYLTPKRDGFALAGTTVERVGFDSSTTQEGEEVIRHFAKTLFPHLSRVPVRGVTAGLRPKSPDDLPVIGPLPDHPNIIIAAGHYRNGILLAPITSKIVASLTTGETPPVPVQPFLPERVLSKI